MGNCLVTKLKGVVNNPDLPYLETMQQFTLDAIAASGNASMTDSQKLALNHFFYRIGAINNSGIYSKLAALYMPMICNSDLDHALVDYKGGTTLSLTGKTIAFQNKGLVATSSSYNNVQTSYADGSVTDLSVGCLYTTGPTHPSPSYRQFGFRKVTADTMRAVQLAAVDNVTRLTLFGKRLDAEYSPVDGFIATLNGSNYSAVFVADEPFTNDSESLDPTLPEGLDITYLYASELPVGIYTFGYALTSQESLTLARAMKELKGAFVV